MSGSMSLSYQYGNLSLKSPPVVFLEFPELCHVRQSALHLLFLLPKILFLQICTRPAFSSSLSLLKCSLSSQWEVMLYRMKWSPHCRDCICLPSLLFFLHSTYHHLNDMIIYIYSLFICLFIALLPPPLEAS